MLTLHYPRWAKKSDPHGLLSLPNLPNARITNRPSFPMVGIRLRELRREDWRAAAVRLPRKTCQAVAV